MNIMLSEYVWDSYMELGSLSFLCLVTSIEFSVSVLYYCTPHKTGQVTKKRTAAAGTKDTRPSAGPANSWAVFFAKISSYVECDLLPFLH